MMKESALIIVSLSSHEGIQNEFKATPCYLELQSGEDEPVKALPERSPDRAGNNWGHEQNFGQDISSTKEEVVKTNVSARLVFVWSLPVFGERALGQRRGRPDEDAQNWFDHLDDSSVAPAVSVI